VTPTGGVPVLATGTGPRLEILSEEDCLLLLRSQAVGRVGFASAALPVILPVNFTVDGHAIVFATEAGAKLDAARTASVACLEVDGYEPLAHTGWSVLATGRLAEIEDPGRLAEAKRLPLSPWATRGALHYVELPIELLSGRRIVR
jgi:nitroimidazol reductase NimA-like FMN-containing flavoprotein (pyridoxamine 5'-phosphate oxidase superfamily)